MGRTILSCLFCLIAGAIINIAIAWGLAYQVRMLDDASHPRAQGLSSGSAPAWIFVRYERFGSTRINAEHTLHLNETLLMDHWGHRPDLIPYWSSIPSLTPPQPLGYWRTERFIEEARGWPLRTLKFSSLYKRTNSWVMPQVTVSNGIKIYEPPGYFHPLNLPYPDELLLALPLKPIWFGLVFNTLFYTVITYFLIIRVSRVIIQSRRKRKGLCPLCKYDLRGNISSGCPECGWGRTKTSDTAQVTPS